jgi:hypothetical protein
MHNRLWKLFPAAVALLLLAGVGLPDAPARAARTTRAGDVAAPPAASPPMGWSTWSFIRHNPTEANVEATAQAMHDSGLQAHGFQYVNVDDFYYVCTAKDGPAADPFGRWVVDTARFPNGMKAVGDFVHGLGLKFGLYVTPGIPNEAVVSNTPIENTPFHAADIANTAFSEKNYNCRHMVGIDYSKPGAQEFVDSWARLLASYGVDYLKIDGVGDSDVADIEAWSRALSRTGRPIHLELSNSLDVRNAPVWRQLSGGWRISGDIECYKCETGGSSYPLTAWASVASRFTQAPQWTRFGGAGHFNDLDSLEIGNGDNDGITPDQRQAHMSLWAISAAPLILGTDLTSLDPADLAMLTNDEVLAVDQAGVPGAPLAYNTPTQVWRAREPDGSYAVALFNTTAASAPVHVSWADLGIQGGATVRDLWSHADLGLLPTGFDATVNPTAARLLRVTPASPTTQVAVDAPSSGRTGTTTLTCTVCTDGVSAGLGGTITFRDVPATQAGPGTVTIAYVNGGAPTQVEVNVNDQHQRVALPSTLTVDAIGTVRIAATLSAGHGNHVTVGLGPGQVVLLDSITVQAGAPAATAAATPAPAAPVQPDEGSDQRPAP